MNYIIVTNGLELGQSHQFSVWSVNQVSDNYFEKDTRLFYSDYFDKFVEFIKTYKNGEFKDFYKD